MRVFVAVCLLLGCAALAEMAPNLILNSHCESGSGSQPAHWGGIDGITCVWGEDGNPGRCLRLDTSVQQADKKAYLTDPEAFAGRKEGGRYSAVGAHEGAWAFSNPVDISPDDRYFVISVDLRASVLPSAEFPPMVMIRGFQRVTPDVAGQNTSFFQVPHAGGPAYSEQFGPESQRRPSQAGDYLMVYRGGLRCRLAAAGAWEHFEMGFTLPSEQRFRPERIWLKPYAFWPLGVYEFDNLQLRRSSKEEVDRINAARPSIRRPGKK